MPANTDAASIATMIQSTTLMVAPLLSAKVY
jgi:hypothetical protein